MFTYCDLYSFVIFKGRIKGVRPAWNWVEEKVSYP